MKIAIFHELDFGGARRTVNEFVKNLSEICDVDLYYVDNVKDGGIKKNPNKTFFYPFRPKSWNGGDWKSRLYKDTIELIKLYKLHKRIALDIKLRKYDYIFVHPSKFTQAPFLLRFLEKKCIYFCQEPLRVVYDERLSNIDYIKFPKNIYEFLNRGIRKWVDRKNFRNANLILANSEFSKNLIEKSYGKSAVVCYLGVDTKIFKPLDLDKSIDILFIGNKDIGYDLLDKMSEFNNQLKVHAIFRESNTSNIDDNELAEIYNKSKILVALNHNEPFGLIPLEAMACGTPVIAVNEGGYKESVLDGKAGFLIPRNEAALYEKVNKIMKNEKLRINMSRNARKNILQNWTWNKTVKSFLRIIKHAK